MKSQRQHIQRMISGVEDQVYRNTSANLTTLIHSNLYGSTYRILMLQSLLMVYRDDRFKTN